ncbi:MAG TPA: 23S rRNA (adenine(2503)-C(2))-methyltransferase RlmN [Kiloniellaceae bacterium]|nr:23S rRNA (adenine(2503)-C(2))-methyltransferase RlmN [Kiloniellaceae bacterium]
MSRSHAQAFAPPPESAATRRNLVGLSRAELAAAMAELGEKPFRAKQLWHWIYHRGETDFAAMTTLSKDFRARLGERFVVARPAVAEAQVSRDGTRKWLLNLPDGQQVETVYIPEEDRGTLCVSSQVGCTLTCKFCHTGTQRLVRNLAPAEIVGQIMVARDGLGEWPGDDSGGPEEGRQVTNIVLMGMGEPLYNYDNVAAAMKIAMDPEGLSISKRKITLSTSGVVPEMERCGRELDVNLAVSLHATADETRDWIMPINKKYPLKMLLDACRNYPGTHNARRITFEYAMLKGVNDSEEDARRLIALLKGIPAKVNLIPFNPWPGSFFECSDAATIKRFADILSAAHISSPVRATRGDDILAACGQLKSESERKKKSERAAAGL